jgi:hypothetical protein
MLETSTRLLLLLLVLVLVLHPPTKLRNMTIEKGIQENKRSGLTTGWDGL